MHFFDVQLSFGEKDIPEKPVPVTTLMVGRSIGCFLVFCIFILSCFFDPTKEAQTEKKSPSPGTHFAKMGLPNHPKETVSTEKGTHNGAHAGFSRPPCTCTCR